MEKTERRDISVSFTMALSKEFNRLYLDYIPKFNEMTFEEALQEFARILASFVITVVKSLPDKVNLDAVEIESNAEFETFLLGVIDYFLKGGEGITEVTPN